LYDNLPSPATFRRQVLAWYRRSGRDLPWRQTRDPYRVLVSEVMLQQTQVARVITAYCRFLARFPTLRALARAPLGAVLREWSGLGYNRRARDLHRIARLHPGGLPADVAGLDALPGVGAYTAGIFHLMTHAFFKALLFLGAGSVIHGMSGEQDIWKMGGLKDKMTTTYGTFAVACLAIAGCPGLSGFFSKDLILEEAFASAHGSPLLWLVGSIGAGLTAFYMFRLLFVTFWGETRASHEGVHHIHESPTSMTWPLVVLAVLSGIGGYFPLLHFLSPVFGEHPEAHIPLLVKYVPTLASLGGIGLAYQMYVRDPGMAARISRQFSGVYRLLLNKYYIDELYDVVVVRPVMGVSNWFWQVWDTLIIDGTVNGTAHMVEANGLFLRLWQTGNVQNYALSFLLGATLILGYYLW